MDILDSTDDDEPFFGFDAEDTVLREVWAESDIDVSSVHTLDLSDWDNRENDFESDVDDQVDHLRDRHGWSEMMRNIGIKPFVQDTGPNIANLAENGTLKDFFSNFSNPQWSKQLLSKLTSMPGRWQQQSQMVIDCVWRQIQQRSGDTLEFWFWWEYIVCQETKCTGVAMTG